MLKYINQVAKEVDTENYLELRVFGNKWPDQG